MDDYSLEEEARRLLEQITSEDMYQHVLRYALTLTRGNEQEAQDLVQHAYLEAQFWLLHHPGKEVSYPLAWLKKIVKNRLLNTKRDKQAKSTTSLDALQQTDTTEDGLPAFQPPAWYLDEPEHALAAAEGEEKLKARMRRAIAITGLDARGKQIAMLHLVEGMSVSELAYHFNISASSVLGYVNRCRYELRLHSLMQAVLPLEGKNNGLSI